MLVLPMTTAGAIQKPAIRLDQLDCLANFHPKAGKKTIRKKERMISNLSGTNPPSPRPACPIAGVGGFCFDSEAFEQNGASWDERHRRYSREGSGERSGS
jgi:hypothetical protein